MRCEWNRGRETHLETNFTLKSEWATHKFADCKAKRDTPPHALLIILLCILSTLKSG